MGIGDQLMGTGLARGARERGKRVAFGDGQKIIWDRNSPEIFRKNKNIAIPGSEKDEDIEWIPFYRGNRIYNTAAGTRWIWNYDFKPTPGELFFDENEKNVAKSIRPDFILIEPNVPWMKSVAPNKDWGLKNYQEVARQLVRAGHDVVQFNFGRDRLQGVRYLTPRSYRIAAAMLSAAKLAILPEGGMHHGAAAVGVPAVVLFGGFIPPQVTGYDTHKNLTGGAEACGSFNACPHCKAAMAKISVEEVLDSCRQYL